MNAWLRWTVFILALCACETREVAVTLTRDDLQAKIGPRFPVSKSIYLVNVTLRDPVVLLPERSDRVGLEMNLDVKVPLLANVSGKIAATGVPRYDPAAHAFYLDKLSVQQLELDGLNPDYQLKARAATELLAGELLATRPIYELQGRNLKEVTAAFVLRRVRVRDGVLQATLALP